MSKSFLQSKQWAKFQESVGRKIFWIEDKLVIKYDLLLGLSYLYSPRPYFDEEKNPKEFLKESQKIAKSENSIFLRLEPDLFKNLSIENSSKIKNLKFEIVHNIQPQDTLILDLNHTEETLLSNMHQKTRYNIRLAEKHGLKIKKSTDPKDIDIFYNLAIKTSQRDQFRYHSRQYYQKMLEILGNEKMMKLYIAYHDKTPVATILVLFYEKTAIYLHGASNHQYRNLMASYLLQWQAIEDAKNRGCKLYDFWGVSPAGQISKPYHPTTLQPYHLAHSWAGITRFKMGFAPNSQIIHYPDCLDLIYQPFWYRIYQLARKIM